MGVTDTRRVSLADNTIGPEEIAAVNEVLAARWLSAGPRTRAFEEEFAAAAGVPDAVAVSSGTAALHLAVLALDLRPGDEVIVPSLSFVASAAVVALHGGVPVFADIRADRDPTIAPEDVSRLLSDRTRAVVVMHYGGYPAAVADIAARAAAHGILVIEDAAHAPLTRVADRTLGTIGDIGCFSFFATKNLTTGEGGMVLAKDRATLERIRAMRSHCVSRSTWERSTSAASGYDVAGIGLNYRPTEIASAIGRVQLRRLATDRAHRRQLVSGYTEALASLPEVSVVTPPVPGDCAHHLMVVQLPAEANRETVQESLHEAGVQSSVHYPPTHLLSHYRDGWRAAAAARESLPVTEALAGRLLTLPLHSRMSESDVAYVVDRLAVALGRTARPGAPR